MENKESFEDDELLSDDELNKIYEKFEKAEEEGIKNILLYFNRIHDKLFSLNNILIAGYFALYRFFDSFSVYGTIIPIVNLIILLGIEYRMMERSRFQKKNSQQIRKHNSKTSVTNWYSLVTIFSTAIVLSIFLYNLFTLDFS